jgi:hypothetical protein
VVLVTKGSATTGQAATRTAAAGAELAYGACRGTLPSINILSAGTNN